MPLFCWFHHFLYSRTEICQIFRCFFGKFKIIKRHSEMNWPLVRLFGARAFRPTSRSGTVHLAEILMHNASSWGNWAVTFDLPSWFCPFTPLLDESKANKKWNYSRLVTRTWILHTSRQGPLNIWTEHSNCQIHRRGTQKPL